MQHLDLEIITEARLSKMKKINIELKQEQIGSLIECPECHYISKKNKRFSCKVFPDSIKCFACGLWRRI